MSAYQSTLSGRTEVAKGTMAFWFKKPHDFVFKAGQYIHRTLSGSPSGSSNGLTRTFSIASSVRRRCSSHDPHADSVGY